MNRNASSDSRRYSQEPELLEIQEPVFHDEPLQKPRKSIHKVDSAKLLTIEKPKNNINISGFKEKKVLDFKNFGRQGIEKSNTPSKTVSFMSNNQTLSSNFNESKGDINEFIKNFAARDLILDANELGKIGLQNNEILIGEYLIDKPENTEIIIGREVFLGRIILTNYRIIFLPTSEFFYEITKYQESFFRIPYMYLDKICKSQEKKANMSYFLLEIYTKDYREIRLKFQETRIIDRISQQLYQSYLPRFREIYALQFAHFLKSLDVDHNGWGIYQPKKEFERQGIDENSQEVRFLDNSNGKFCTTYPAICLVPRAFSDEFIVKAASFRSRERLPVLTYMYYCKFGKKQVKSFLWRSSQCKPGITDQRSSEDEAYLSNLSTNESSNVKNLRIFDARPYLNALANKVNGKGYESTNIYRNIELRFLNIHNIQKVREAYRKLTHASYNTDPNFKWLTNIENSTWFEFLKGIIHGSLEIVDSLKKGYNCLIHCSDGWDRTAQLLSLVQIMIDPYFRTLEGFMVLIEKEWVSFGHQFALRSGHGKNINDDQKAQIFVQFLDCVHQLFTQFPLSFEYNINFLTEIAHHTYTCFYGNFLYDTDLEKKIVQIEDRTVSLWSYILGNKEKFLNSFYKTPEEIGIKEIFPNPSIKCLRFWKEHFLKHLPDCKDKYKISNFTEEIFSVQYSFAIKEKDFVKKELKKIKFEMEKQKEKLLKYEEKFGKIDDS